MSSPSMPPINQTMLIATLSSGLTSMFSAWLTYLAAWSHFSSADNSGLAAILAAGAATLLGMTIVAIFTRMQSLLNTVGTNGTRIFVPDQKVADSLPNNPRVLGPNDATVVMKDGKS